jgi:hypothetical protein
MMMEAPLAYPDSPMEDDVAYPCKGCGKVHSPRSAPLVFTPLSRADVGAFDIDSRGRKGL